MLHSPSSSGRLDRELQSERTSSSGERRNSGSASETKEQSSNSLDADRPARTCNDDRGPLRGLLPLLHSVLVHLVLDLLQLVHGVQTVSPPLLLDRFAQLRLVGELLRRLHNLLLQGKSALQVPQEGILHGREPPLAGRYVMLNCPL